MITGSLRKEYKGQRGRAIATIVVVTALSALLAGLMFLTEWLHQKGTLSCEAEVVENVENILSPLKV